MSDQFEIRIVHLKQQLLKMTESNGFKFDEHLHGNLPEKHGIYRIFLEGDPEKTLRAGRTKSAVGGLRQRVYQNHFQGNQAGNIRQQMVGSGRCADLEAAKQYLRNCCRVQVQVIENDEERKWIEYFMLSIICPVYTD